MTATTVTVVKTAATTCKVPVQHLYDSSLTQLDNDQVVCQPPDLSAAFKWHSTDFATWTSLGTSDRIEVMLPTMLMTSNLCP